MRTTILLAALMSIGTPAAAQPAWIQGWYAGGGVSATRVAAQGGYGRSNPADSSSIDAGIVVTGGYRWRPHIAFEFGYSGGSGPGFSTTATSACAQTGPCRADVEQATSALDASVVAILPFASLWEIYLKIGAAAWDAESSQLITSTDSGASIRRRVDDDGLDLLIGAGGGVALGEHAHLRLDYEVFRTEDELLAVDRDALFEQFSLEFHWRFR